MDSQESVPSPLVETSQGRAIMDRQITSLRENGITDITCLADYHIEKMVEAHSGIEYIHVPEGMDEHHGSTLAKYPELVEGDVLIATGEVFFTEDTVEKLLQTDADITVAVSEFPSDSAAEEAQRVLDTSELVYTDEGITIASEAGPTPDGRVLGVMHATPRGANAIRTTITASNTQIDKIPELLSELSDTGVDIKQVDVTDEVQQVDEQYALAQFLLGTKAETLDRIDGLVTKSRVPDQLVFDVPSWETDPEGIVDDIQTKFQERKIVVRSSAAVEDGWDKSKAGAFHSELGVDPVQEDELQDAVVSVINSLRAGPAGTDEDEVLIQPYISDVIASGVAFTRDLDSGGPYTVINYDDSSGRTDTVTSGQKEGGGSVYIHQDASEREQLEEPVAAVRSAVDEIRELLNDPPLDIEFAVDSDGEVIILQVRPLAVHTGDDRFDMQDVNHELDTSVQTVKELQRSRPLLYGDTTVLGVMPDWNPAEMIGDEPDALAISLYRTLITDSVWARARAESGYRDVRPAALMVTLAGRPYIDTRVDFNSFLPATLPEDLSERLVSHYLDRLASNPNLHDSIEFDVAFTSLDFDFDGRRNQLAAAGFDDSDIELLRTHLRTLTDQIVRGQVASIETQVERLEAMGRRRKALLADRPGSWSETVRRVSRLLEDCRNRGTLPFAILARYAFIGKSFLQSLVSRGVMSEEQRSRFLEGINTIASDVADDTKQLSEGEVPTEAFLEKYGHLRPGTYDIQSRRYDEAPGEYFDLSGDVPDLDPVTLDQQREPVLEGWEPTIAPKTREVFDEIRSDIERLIDEEGFEFTSDQLYEFITRSIPLRELSKFAFTRNLSSALTLLRWSAKEHLSFDPEDLAHLSVDQITESAGENQSPVVRREFERAVNHSRKRKKIQKRVQFPPLITTPKSAMMFEITAEEPHFITNNSITAEIVRVEEADDGVDLDGKIVLIPSADPGYDWIFGSDIAGLVTKYGGVASHMAIRAAEFDIPAAIGCGEVEYERVASTEVVEIDCKAGQIRGVR
jgi:phosphohistidine swiveling domain-containing protein